MEESRTKLIVHYPFYANVLSKAKFEWTTKLPTAAVTLRKGQLLLKVNKEFFYSLSAKHRCGLLMHEVLHLALLHLQRGQGLNPKKANVAMDVALNQLIPKELLPPGALLPKMFKLPEELGFEEYYPLLKDEDVASVSTLDDHSQWEEADGDAADQISGIVNQASEGLRRGEVPIAIEKAMEAFRAERAENWQTILKRYIGRARSAKHSPTRTRLNRRMGFMAPGKKRFEAPKILVALDESGSVSDDDRQKLLAELPAILDNSTDKTEVIFFDTEVQHSIKLDRVRELPRRASGGTEFDCVIKHALDVKPSVVIVLTDGGAPDPVKPSKLPVIWVIVDGGDGQHLSGRKVVLKHG